MDKQYAVEVLICGAGAAGLTLAIDLARQGVPFRLIDTLDKPFAGSRGKGVQPRTLEVFEDLGFVDRVAAVGGVYPPQREYRPNGSYTGTQEMIATAPVLGEPYRTPLIVPQFRTEAVMRERLAELGAAPRYGHTLDGFDQDTHGVTVYITGPLGQEAIRCRYLIAGDGGRSTIRRALDIGFPGKTLGVRAIVADVALDGLSRDAWHRFNEGDMARNLAFCPLPHTDTFQLQAPIALEGEIDLTNAGIQRFVDERLPGSEIVIRGVAWASAYGMNARLADRYRVGRVFLMGDAAHIHPPTGGQGLNTSVQDAYNLGWKLGAVLAGAPEALLDTYEEERRPIAAGMLGLATALLEKAKQGDMRRGREVHQLDLNYPSSSLTLAAPMRHADVLPGDRMPDVSLSGAAGQPQRLFDLLRGPHWTLVAHGAANPALPVPTQYLHIVRIAPDAEYRDPDRALASMFDMADDDVLLIRPDGYIGALIASAQAWKLGDYLATVLAPRNGLGGDQRCLPPTPQELQTWQK